MKLSDIKYWILFCLFLIPGFYIRCLSQPIQKTVINGTVKDAKTGETLPFVAVVLKNTTTGTVTDYNGKYTIETTSKVSAIIFSFLGYTAESKPVTSGITQTINVTLNPSTFNIDEVVVRPPRKKYTNRNNRAVELIDKVIENKSVNRPEGFDFLRYDKYEKIQFALSNFGPSFKDDKAFSRVRFIFDNIDTTKQEGKEILPMFIKEALSTCYYRKNPKGDKEVIRGEKTIDFDEYLDNKGVSANLKYLYQNINIYDNDILFLTNKFLSPVANAAPVFYKYYVIDTVKLNDVSCVKLLFEPRNRADFLFEGYLYILQDSTYAIKKVEMGLNNHINIDWVKDVKIVQDFVQVQKNAWMVSKDEISINFGITKKSIGLFGQRTVSYTDYDINNPIGEEIFKGPEIIRKLDRDEKSPAYWETNRTIPLSKSESGIYTMVDSIKQVPAFKRDMTVIMLLTTEFLTFKKIELGPASTFYSFNPIEGSRVRLGGRTTPGFSRKITFDSYLAYGFTDNRFKYSAGITYSLTGRTIYEFPVKSIRISYQYDTRIPGQELQYSQSDNVFLSFKRGVNDKLLYNGTLNAEYLNEFENHFSYQIGYNYTKQSPAGNLFFNPVDYLSPSNSVPYINISEVNLNLRYAQDESFYQGKLYRDPFPNKYPVMLLKYSFGSKAFGNSYGYSKIQFNIFKRFFYPIIGYSDITVDAGKIFGKVSYPLLFIHNANQTYSYQKLSYNLMNFLEFVSDEYVSINIDHCFNGFIFNKIPLLKKFKLRELVTCKVLYGGVTNRNNPSLQQDLFKFPTDQNGVPLTYSLVTKPYIEAGVGLSNIFKIFRVDLIKRLTYNHNPNVSDVGFRVQFRFDL